MFYTSPHVYDVATWLQLSVGQRLVYTLGMGINVVNERDSHSQCRPKSYVAAVLMGFCSAWQIVESLGRRVVGTG